LENTKKCTKCGNRIEKQGGCFQMTCRCSHQFCWLCGKDWSTHSDHFSCSTHPEAGRPEQVGNKVLYLQNVQWDGDELKVKLMDRYKFYEDQQKAAKEKSSVLNGIIHHLKEAQLLRYDKPVLEAAAQLDECRRIIKGMVVIRLGTIGSLKQNLAAAQAQSIEYITEKLGDKYEKDFLKFKMDGSSELTFKDIKDFVDDLARLTLAAEKQVQNILQGDKD